MTTPLSPQPGTPGGVPAAQLLDPIERFVALHHDLPALRRELGAKATERLQAIEQDILASVAGEHDRLWEAAGDYGNYLERIGAAARDGEREFRADLRVWRDLKLDEAMLQRVVRLLQFRLVAYLEATL